MSTRVQDSASSGDVPAEVTATMPSSDNDNAATHCEEEAKPSDGDTSPVDGKENMPLAETAVPKKKKKSKKSKGQKKRPTGFEGKFNRDVFFHDDRKSTAPFSLTRNIDIGLTVRVLLRPPYHAGRVRGREEVHLPPQSTVR